VNDQEVINFLQQNIISRFNIPTSLVFENKSYFSSLIIYDFPLENGIILKHLANFYPQGNCLDEYTNKNLIHVIKKTIFSEQQNWHFALVNDLWVDRVTPRPSLNTSPYFLVYGKEAIFSPNIYLFAYKLSQESQGNPCLLMQRRMETLHKLQEEKLKAKEKISLHQNHIKRCFDKKSTWKNKFSVGNLALKWDKAHEDKGRHTNFQSLWIGPFIVQENLGQHIYHLQSLGRKIDYLPITGKELKHYFE